MTEVKIRPPSGAETPATSEYTFGALVVPGIPPYRRLAIWASVHRASLIIVTVLLVATSFIRFWNFANTPGAWNDDEGTYVAQAWALLTKGQLAHYTYWYDHPPFGWMQIAGWAWLTNGFGRDGVSIQIGRELVAVYSVIAAGCIYALCRRLGMLRVFSALALVLFMVSPLGMTYGRMVYLDSLMIPWAIGGLLAATYAGKSSWWALLSGVLLAGAVLTKETSFFFVPIALWIVWRMSDRRLRLKNTITTAMLTVLIGLSYILLAILKNELIPGPGHVSLGYSIVWQLFLRQGGGYVWNNTSLTFLTARDWVATDPVLLWGGLLLLGVLALRRSLWPIGVLALLHVLMLTRNGYTPIPYAVILVPLGALVVAGAIDTLWQRISTRRLTSIAFKSLSIMVTAGLVLAIAVFWTPKIAYQWSNTNLSYEEGAVAWIEKHSPASAHDRIVSDDNIWPDLITRGYSRTDVDWFYKLDVDPAVMKRYIPKGGSAKDAWKSIDYVVIPLLADSLLETRPSVYKAIQHSTIVANFNGPGVGQYRIFKVKH